MTRGSCGALSKSQCESVPRDTEKSKFLDLVDFGGVAISVESVTCVHVHSHASAMLRICIIKASVASVLEIHGAHLDERVMLRTRIIKSWRIIIRIFFCTFMCIHMRESCYGFI